VAGCAQAREQEAADRTAAAYDQDCGHQ